MELRTPLGRLRLLALLEGISYLLFGITMPLKYLWSIPEPNFYVGLIHGWLFVLYVILALQNAYLHSWNMSRSLLVLIAALIPLGTFLADRKLLKPLQQPLV